MTRRTPSLILCLSLCFCLVCGARFPDVRHASARPCDETRLFDEAAASKILATQRPFAPADRDLFFSYERADWGDVAPIQYAKGPGLTERETKEELRSFLKRRFPCSSRRVLDGLAVFGNPIARQRIPDPTLRAALAALTGTLGEPAIAYVLYQAPVSLIHFGVVLDRGQGFPTPGVETVFKQGGMFDIVFDGQYRFGRFAMFSTLLFHEALHVEIPLTGTDAGAKPIGAGLPEEATAVALESLVYMQMLLTDPSLATLPDPQTRGWNNRLTLVRLNSGLAGTDRLNLFLPGSDVNLDPMAVAPVTEFYEFYPVSFFDGPGDPAWRARETRGTPLLVNVLRAIAEPGHAPPATPDFDRATLDFIDQNQPVLAPGEFVAEACILELDVPCA